MYSISEVVRQTGFTAHTLRYYEKIGLLVSPVRQNGKRMYSEGDISLLQFMKLLKNTGMSLEDIQEFLVDGCLIENKSTNEEKNTKVYRRIEILEKHLLSLEQQRIELDQVMKLTEEKLVTYKKLLEANGYEE